MSEDSVSKTITAEFSDLGDWRGDTLAHLRTLIQKAAPDVVEELKWKKASNPSGVPVWSDGGMICTGEVYKDHVKLTFAKGASLADPHGLFNASLDGSARRAIDVYEGGKVNASAFTALVRAAVALNKSTGDAKSELHGAFVPSARVLVWGVPCHWRNRLGQTVCLLKGRGRKLIAGE